MATYNVSITQADGWVEVSGVDTVGWLTCTSGNFTYALFVGKPPETLLGHRFISMPIQFTCTATESLWVRTDVDKGGTAIITL